MLGMQRLSGLDASFLYLETPSQPMHVCSIMELDTSTMPEGYSFDLLRDALSLRIKAIPEFREKLANSPLNLDHPVWVDDENFVLDRHLHRIALPAPGGRAGSSGSPRGHCSWPMWCPTPSPRWSRRCGGRATAKPWRGRSPRRPPHSTPGSRTAETSPMPN